eukprot:Blabericola_migrator_1__11147@NODE_652_length_7028_cov_94_522195_g478_i0_p2_GENE_NODE_652_length_7028_cov_94_522195_g478_i0NODE_652_length_7028_cov_94_522195_g478_i0_p2_ORF_typecomplete_len130_score0_60DEDD_Tnp_IS110/PF01548_17/3_6DEDD_Tnp_IS110/PF01548_17/34_NODE_652_length_7028_cov_94_522195_g478_i045074896
MSHQNDSRVNTFGLVSIHRPKAKPLLLRHLHRHRGEVKNRKNCHQNKFRGRCFIQWLYLTRRLLCSLCRDATYSGSTPSCQRQIQWQLPEHSKRSASMETTLPRVRRHCLRTLHSALHEAALVVLLAEL